MSDLEWRAGEVTSLFTRLFRCDGRRFGSRPRGVMGVSDNVEGVQWNAGCCRHETHVWLGVNLRGRRVEVTLLRSGRKVEREVTPHLAFKTWLPKTTLDAMRRAKDNLEALHAFARRQARPWDPGVTK